MAEVSSWDRVCMACVACVFTIYRKSLLTPALKDLSNLLWSRDQLVMDQELELRSLDTWLFSFFFSEMLTVWLPVLDVLDILIQYSIRIHCD